MVMEFWIMKITVLLLPILVRKTLMMMARAMFVITAGNSLTLFKRIVTSFALNHLIHMTLIAAMCVLLVGVILQLQCLLTLEVMKFQSILKAMTYMSR